MMALVGTFTFEFEGSLPLPASSRRWPGQR
jgi:hypothetical protein